MCSHGFRPKQWQYSWDAHDRLTAVTTPAG
ncbi:RHS repeat protein, partial [Motilimonas sp. E26]|nr:RHS repeat protein [Motilimonas sp. E26]